MGRKAKVPLKNGAVIPVSRVGASPDTPHHPREINWAVLDRLGFDGELPSFADERGGA